MFFVVTMEQMSHKPMSDEHQAVLQKCHVLLCQDLDVQIPMDYLYQEGMFSEDDRQRVDFRVTDSDKRRKFLSILKTKPDQAYRIFMDSLWKSESQRHLSDALKRDLQNIAPIDENGICY